MVNGFVLSDVVQCYLVNYIIPAIIRAALSVPESVHSIPKVSRVVEVGHGQTILRLSNVNHTNVSHSDDRYYHIKS